MFSEGGEIGFTDPFFLLMTNIPPALMYDRNRFVYLARLCHFTPPFKTASSAIFKCVRVKLQFECKSALSVTPVVFIKVYFG